MINLQLTNLFAMCFFYNSRQINSTQKMIWFSEFHLLFYSWLMWWGNPAPIFESARHRNYCWKRRTETSIVLIFSVHNHYLMLMHKCFLCPSVFSLNHTYTWKMLFVLAVFRLTHCNLLILSTFILFTLWNFFHDFVVP